MDKQRKELLFLGVGLAVLLAALYFTFKPSARPAQATTQAPAQETATATAQAPEQPAAQVQPSAAPIPMSQGGTTPGRNPFTPVIVAAAAAPPHNAPPPMLTAMGPRPLPPIEPMSLRLFPQPGAPPATGVMTPTAGPQPGAPTPTADPPLRLTGVIYGNPSMAIIRKGDKRYFVRPGDPVGSRYSVQSISQRQVVLASSQGTLSLELTGRM